MAQLHGIQYHGDSSTTVEQLSDGPSACNVQRKSEGRMHSEDNFHHSKKISVIAKVKEKAKKWRQTLSRKKHGHDNGGVDDEIDVDPELHGGSNARQRMFGQTSNRSGKNNTKKSTGGATLPKSYSDNQRGNPSIPKNIINDTYRAKSFDKSHHRRAPSPINSRIEHIVAERNAGILKDKLIHLQASREFEPEELKHPCDIIPTRDFTDKSSILEQKSMLPVIGSTTRVQTHFDTNPLIEQKGKLPILEKSTNETESDKTNVNDVKEKFQSCTTPAKSDQEKEELNKTEGINAEEETSPTSVKTVTEAVTETIAPAYASVSEATHKIATKIQGSMPSFESTGEEQNYDKGISVKAYIRNKLDPGEDERALSQVISEVISPRRTPSEKGVVEKAKEAVSLMLQSEESPSSSSMKKSESTSSIPVSSNAHEVEEESRGRILQAN